jgi:hypothetical protein
LEAKLQIRSAQVASPAEDSVIKCQADKVTFAPDQTALANGLKIIERQAASARRAMSEKCDDLTRQRINSVQFPTYKRARASCCALIDF